MARVFTWTPPTGDPITLNDSGAGYRLMQSGTRGLSAPPYRVTAATYAGEDGTTLQNLDADQRDITLGLQVEGSDAATFRDRWRALIRAFRPKAGDGTLTVAAEDGTTRTLDCRYTGGLEGDGDAEFTGTIGRAAVKLTAFDPWWYGDAETVNAGLGAGAAFFPILPMLLAPSSVQGAFTIDLTDSDDGAWPVWTIQGPGTGLVLTNSTSGLSLSLDVTLGVGESMTVDTRPGMKSARAGDGTNLMPTLTAGTDPNLWPLLPAVNDIQVTLSGATTVSRIVGSYRPRYAGI